MRWTEEEMRAMDIYLWLDYSIETLWLKYMVRYQGDHSITVEEEIAVLRTMDVIYDMETKIIDLIDKYSITFSMIDEYKEAYNVRSWPTRFC